MAIWTLVELFFGGRKGAIVAVVLGVVALGAGGWLVKNAFTISNLRTEVATAKEETARTREKLAVVTANRDNLKASLERQNDSVASLQQSNEALTREANLRAALLLANAQRESAAIRATPPANVEELNAWFRALLQ